MPLFGGGYNAGEGADRLGSILNDFQPDMRDRFRRRVVEGAFYNSLDPNNALGFLNQGAERVAADALRPGGSITEAIRGARGQSIGSGFGTDGGVLSRQENNVVNEGLRSSVGSYIGQSLPGIYEGAANRAAGGFEMDLEDRRRLLEGRFTGQAAIESLRQSNARRGFLGIF